MLKMNNKVFHRKGFVLILVIGVLAVLSALAINLISTSRHFVNLSHAKVLNSKSKLLARSGIESALLSLKSALEQDIRNPINIGDQLTLSYSNFGPNICNWNVRDSSGAINLNDGINAGKLEHGSFYVSSAIDPWPAGTIDKSALTNLRLRRLLNAYGDVHKFLAEIGQPDSSNLGTPFTFSSTAVGNRNTTMPGRDNFGTSLFSAIDIKTKSTGLGDRIIASRTGATGFHSIEEIKNIANDWASDVILSSALASYTNGRNFFELVSDDFTVVSWEDTQFFRLKNEIGIDVDGDGQTDYPNDFTNSRIVNSSGTRLYRRLEDNPPDLTDLWSNHSVPVINLNSASVAVRSAIFYSPINVSYIAEGTEAFFRNHPTSPMTTTKGPDVTNIDKMVNHWPLLGIAGPVFRSTNMKENGFPAGGYAGSDPFFSNVQRNRLMSLKDSLMLATEYQNVGTTLGWPDSFEDFTQFLRQVRSIVTLERADQIDSSVKLHQSYLRGIQYFDQHYLEITLPHILSCNRRIPGWMFAPIALLSPYIQEGGAGISASSATDADYFSDVDSDMALRSAEDFVFRWALPKVTFLPSGIFRLTSHATVRYSPTENSRQSIQTNIRFFENHVIRTQATFSQFTDSSTSNLIKFGPEPLGNPISQHLGVAGLKDRATGFALGTAPNRIKMDFDGNLNPDPSSTVFPADSTSDPLINATIPTPSLSNSEIEGNSISIFGMDSTSSNLSPFGGINLSSIGHGPHATGEFNDSLYFRPINNNATNLGQEAIEGYVSCWVRMPSGYAFFGQNHTIFTLTLWDRAYTVKSTTNAYPPAPGELLLQLRPIQFQASISTTNKATTAVGYGIPVNNPNQFGVSFHKATGGSGDIISGSPWFHLSDPYPSLLPSVVTNVTEYYANAQNIMGYPGKIAYFDPLWGNWWFAFRSTNANTTETVEKTTTRYYENDVSYSSRPGSWTRWVFRWDLKNLNFFNNVAWNYALHEKHTILLTPHDESENWAGSAFRPAHGEHYQVGGRYNPKNLLIFGEEAWYVNSSPASLANDRSIGTALIPSSSFNNGNYIPIKRLNSSIDNIVVEIGALPASFRVPSSPPYITSGLTLKGSTEEISGFESIRYDVTGQPKWVIDPQLKKNSKLLSFGSRIYDVPFNPQFGDDGIRDWAIWTIKSPRIDISVEDPTGAAITETDSSNSIVENGIKIKSTAWKSYSAKKMQSQSKFILQYMNSDVNGDSLSSTLADIPWIKEVNWKVIPNSGPKILSWSE